MHFARPAPRTPVVAGEPVRIGLMPIGLETAPLSSRSSALLLFWKSILDRTRLPIDDKVDSAKKLFTLLTWLTHGPRSVSPRPPTVITEGILHQSGQCGIFYLLHPPRDSHAHTRRRHRGGQGSRWLWHGRARRYHAGAAAGVRGSKSCAPVMAHACDPFVGSFALRAAGFERSPLVTSSSPLLHGKLRKTSRMLRALKFFTPVACCRQDATLALLTSTKIGAHA